MRPISKLDFQETCFYIFIFLFPILPEFCRLFDRASFEWIVVFETIIFLLTCKGRILDKKFIIYLFVGLVFYLIMYGAHGEWTSTITIAIDCFLPILIIYNNITSRERLFKTFNVILYAGLIQCAFAVVEILFEYNLFSMIQTIPADEAMGALKFTYRDGIVRVEGSFGQPIPFAMYMLFLNFICLIIFKKANILKEKSNNLAKVVYVLSFIIILLTISRMVIILTLLMQILYIATFPKNKRIIIFLIALILILFFVLIISLSDSSTLRDAFYAVLAVFDSSYYEKMSDGGQNVSYRLYLFQALGDTIFDNLWIGIGYDDFSTFSFHVVTSVTEWQATSIDNNLLSTLLTYGIIGFIAKYFLLISVIIHTITRLISKREDKTFYLMALFIAIIYLLYLMSVAQLTENRIFYVLVGVYWAFDRLRRNACTSLKCERIIYEKTYNRTVGYRC